MKIYFIRHTSVAVKIGICYGQTDVPVAASFEDEKNRIALRFAGIHVDKVYASPLARCKILAESIFPGEELCFDARLKELNFGDWEMMSWDDIYFDPVGKLWMDNYKTLPTQNGESYPAMLERVQGFFEKLKQINAGSVAVFTHAGVIRIMKSIIDKQPVDKLFETFRPAYGSVIEFEI